jgi:hypothetical protein
MHNLTQFSVWSQWSLREQLFGIEFPGIYCIAISEYDISDHAFDWDENINYIGMTNSTSGLKGRLKQFDNTLKGKTGHGGADRFRYDYQNYDHLISKLFVSVKYFICDVRTNLPADLLVMGDVAKHEFECFAKFIEIHNRIPRYNDKQNTKKYSLTFGRQL